MKSNGLLGQTAKLPLLTVIEIVNTKANVVL